MRNRSLHRTRCPGEAGFTLVELLVVMLILGLLAAIAVPTFFSQKDKANDSDAKASVRAAESATEAYAAENDGNYAGAVVADLVRIEPTLNDAPNAPVGVSEPATINPQPTDAAKNSYTVSVQSKTGTTFSITRHHDGTTDLTCDDAGSAGCPGSGGGQGNWG